MNARSELHRNRTLFARDSRDEEMTVEPRRLREVDVKGLVIRFVFGFAISVIVGVIGLVAGDRTAGLFLAFPAILPASLTLIAENDGDDKAKVDAAGACFGGLGLAAFGFASWYLLPRSAPVLAELAALIAWCVIAIGSYMAVRARLRSR
jgi:hypothetical protein